MADFITLAEYSQLLDRDGKFLTSGIVDTLRKESSLLGKMPFANVNSLKAKGMRIATLPTSQNRKLNEAYTHPAGRKQPLVRARGWRNQRRGGAS